MFGRLAKKFKAVLRGEASEITLVIWEFGFGDF